MNSANTIQYSRLGLVLCSEFIDVVWIYVVGSETSGNRDFHNLGGWTVACLLFKHNYDEIGAVFRF